MRQSRILPLLFIICILLTPAMAVYTWTGQLNVGNVVYINDMQVKIDKDKNKNITAAIILYKGEAFLVKEGESAEIDDIEISVNSFKDYAILSVSSDKPFEINFDNKTTGNEDLKKQISNLKEENTKLRQENERLKGENQRLKDQINKLTDENKQLKRRISELEKQKPASTKELEARLLNLTKENRKLKMQLANLTRKYNEIKAKAEFLEAQNEEYRSILQKLIEEEAQKSKQNYVEKAKKERLIGSIIIKSLVFGLVVVGIVGYGLYRKKRSWELGGL